MFTPLLLVIYSRCSQGCDELLFALMVAADITIHNSYINGIGLVWAAVSVDKSLIMSNTIAALFL